MAEAFIAIGSNLNDRKKYMINAVKELCSFSKIVIIAPLYKSEPYGFTNQPYFFNSAILLETDVGPQELLDKLKGVEKKLGRKSCKRWGPRKVDLDIIFYNQKIVKTDQLTIPHSDFHNRNFVLRPLADIAPDFVSPVHHETISQLLGSCQDETKIKLIATDWYINEIEF